MVSPSFFQENEFFLDQSRCIGCQACVQACAECDTHRGHAMIHLEYIDRPTGVQTAPVVCMHCEDPTCAQVCPADAIKQDDDGIVHSAAKPRCVSCSNCVIACPFGVPKMNNGYELMMKCDMCYDRTSLGKKPMCATVCPSDALYFGKREDIERIRQEKPVNEFQFGLQTVKTKVNMMTAQENENIPVDVADFMAGATFTLPETRTGAPDVANTAVFDLPEIVKLAKNEPVEELQV
ncbi:4Fe-4S dicluster domain-containing protein [Pelagicoccus mobilis]|uniref:4Fe-4S dicluster domain-containing protein n=1 Tax=Pelagicoccus mobilis TaxID=415221 RepID=UPI002D80167B|nr:4Fe-4S dicluster domain-containing protein [Pelagicoccus mobilis]